MGLGAIVDKLNRYEGLFEKLGLLTVLVFFLMVVAGFTDSSHVGKLMSLVLLFLVALASLIGVIIYRSLD
ncbi:hypothetical protein [Thermococcus sp.]|uniref:hypothetical protein n=1 Tax=Thermococcus sp. TaxID=35749 RepID=UPI00260FA045|nr:hypothetical protein [Thermococcus sp.]